VRINFDLIEQTPNPTGKIRTRPKQDRLSVDEVWVDLPDEAFEELDETASEPAIFEQDDSQCRSLRQVMTLWCIAVVLLSACYVGNSVLQESISTATAPPAFQIDVNSASFEELLLLEGVGELTAEKILAERNQNGHFSSPDDLQRVAGIGPKTVDNLRDSIRCEE